MKFSNLGNGFGLYLSFGGVWSVAVDEGNTIREEIVEFIRDCEVLCSASLSCKSFRYCFGDGANSCTLKDKMLTGDEPKKIVERCSTHYFWGGMISK